MAKTKKLGDLVNQTVTLSAPLSGGGPLTDTLNFSITKANTTTDGYVSKEDWNTFKNKQDALGFTPYNATNPDGYITSSALTPYAPLDNPTFTTAINTPLINGISGLVQFKSTDNINIGNASTTGQRILRIGQGTASMDIGNATDVTGAPTIFFNQSTFTLANAALTGSQFATILNSNNQVFIRLGNGNQIAVSITNHVFTPSAASSGAITPFTFTKPASTNQTLSTAIAGWNVNGGSRQWATGAITAQSENVWGATTYSFVGASTITNAYGNEFNAPIAGTNCTITNNFSAKFNAPISLTQTVTTETVVSNKTVTIVINGTTYKLLAV